MRSVSFDSAAGHLQAVLTDFRPKRRRGVSALKVAVLCENRSNCQHRQFGGRLDLFSASRGEESNLPDLASLHWRCCGCPPTARETNPLPWGGHPRRPECRTMNEIKSCKVWTQASTFAWSTITSSRTTTRRPKGPTSFSSASPIGTSLPEPVIVASGLILPCNLPEGSSTTFSLLYDSKNAATLARGALSKS